ncbi:transmembrane 4 L6 family member 4 [Monodon monoceros]|uniref:Transmembrane 4 L six family member 4 n=5 Tax=Odontoceti TaxID=9722 RepID=A0A8C6F2H2_MONMO|nr:transmembrane 4 L6 family member 4 [Delphinapterus leucas]XP_029071076.1 transmembrane 4 L6 family member 4 [Monodon monoceros]XP_032486896.1 transmembrane 4 L6 family member 4 [Phocoena sinus]
MCTERCAKCLGSTLIPLAVSGFLAHLLLFFPGGKVIDNNDHLSDEVWYFGGILGSGVLMIFPALVFLGLENNDCCRCCGNESCGKRFAMFTSTIFAVVGVLGAGYSFIISAVSINKGPKCLMVNNSTWGYPFLDGDYLRDRDLWSQCEKPDNVIPWHLTLFSILLIIGAFQILICAIQVINGLLGTLCGDCQCCGCCRGDGPV